MAPGQLRTDAPDVVPATLLKCVIVCYAQNGLLNLDNVLRGNRDSQFMTFHKLAQILAFGGDDRELRPEIIQQSGSEG